MKTTKSKRNTTRKQSSKHSAIARWRGRGRRRSNGAPLWAVAFSLGIMAYALISLFEIDSQRVVEAASESRTAMVHPGDAPPLDFEFDVVELAREAGL